MLCLAATTAVRPSNTGQRNFGVLSAVFTATLLIEASRPTGRTSFHGNGSFGRSLLTVAACPHTDALRCRIVAAGIFAGIAATRALWASCVAAAAAWVAACACACAAAAATAAA